MVDCDVWRKQSLANNADSNIFIGVKKLTLHSFVEICSFNEFGLPNSTFIIGNKNCKI